MDYKLLAVLAVVSHDVMGCILFVDMQSDLARDKIFEDMKLLLVVESIALKD